MGSAETEAGKVDMVRRGTRGPVISWEDREREHGAAPSITGPLSKGLGPSVFRTMPAGSGRLGISAAYLRGHLVVEREAVGVLSRKAVAHHPQA